MIKAKKLLTKAVATITCAAMLAGSSLSSFAAGFVSMDPSLIGEFDDEGKTFYALETPDYMFWWYDDGGAAFVDQDAVEALGIEDGTVIDLGGKLFKVTKSEYDKEGHQYVYEFSYVGTEEDYFGDSYVDNIGKKILEIYKAQNNQSLNYNNHVVYKEGDGIRYDMMEALSKTKGVVLDFYFTYKGKRYHATLTSEKAKEVYNKDIAVYGPVFIMNHFTCEEISYGTE